MESVFYAKDILLGDYEDFDVKIIYVPYTLFQMVGDIQRLEQSPSLKMFTVL